MLFWEKVSEEVLTVRHFYELTVYENLMKSPKYFGRGLDSRTIDTQHYDIQLMNFEFKYIQHGEP